MPYSYSTNEESFTGSFDTPEEAAEECFEADDDCEGCFVGENKCPSTFLRPIRIGEHVAEYLGEQIGDRCGEIGYDWQLSEEVMMAIGAAVLKTIADKGGFRIWAVENVKYVDRPKTTDAEQGA